MKGGFKSSDWAKSKNLAEIMASHRRKTFKKVKVKKTKTKNYGDIYEVFYDND